MTGASPTTILNPDYSTLGAVATPWADARAELERAEIGWLATVHPDGRPHATPLLFIWLADVLYFCTGAQERKALNLAQNAHCLLTTGSNTLNRGRDIVIEGDATVTRDVAILEQLAARYASKYDWHFTVRDGEFIGEQDNVAQVYAVVPQTVFAFDKGESSGQTRYRF